MGSGRPIRWAAMYAVILAGGGGTRLWPLSRPETPKPFLPLTGERSLLQLTFDRLVGHPELALQPADVSVVTDRRYAPVIAAQLPGVRVISEPAGRNTAVAIALAALVIDREPDDVMLVLPADHLIAPDKEGVYRSVLNQAQAMTVEAFGIESPLVTLGVAPDRPAVEYGYLLPDVVRGEPINGLQAYPLLAFEEKPTRDRAEELRSRVGTAWNAGIFLWRRQAIRDTLARYTALMTLIEPVVTSESGLVAAYDQLRPVSIDRAVMESAAQDHRVVMGAMSVGWSDLGGWTALLAAVGAHGEGRVVPPGSSAAASENDLIVERVDGVLAVVPGPRAILAPNPTALLVDAAGTRSEVEALVSRVATWEDRS
jgi:mannose-1-phosphate guanylyltransferase